MLLDIGSEIYLKDPIRVDYSPIFIAVKTGQIEMIEMMCDTGA